MARKKINADERLKYDVKTRINQAHYDRLNKLLTGSRYRSMSELLREMICFHRITVYTKDESLSLVMEELAAIRGELNAIGVNINQVTRRFHGTSDKHQKMLHLLEITELYRQVGAQLDTLFPTISALSQKWLQDSSPART